MDGFDELIVHGNRNAVAEQRGFQRAGEVMRARAEHVRLDGGCVGCRDGVFHAAVGFVKPFVRVPADAAIRAHEEHAVGAVGELDFLAVFVRDRAVLQIHVRKHGKDVMRAGKRVLRHGKQALFLRGKRMLPAAVDIE
ncbi:hypothetical protein SDC9_80307 [bioreactor metagenome]|uniref:Uncharacterized protein n=1 Tax=bioreactor metagenome TaxID=1076179 RepID=A0A644YZL4_9ZZZZ